MKSVEVLGVDSLPKLVSFLEHHRLVVKYVDYDQYGYSRTIQFEHNEQVYQIVWYNNESKLKIGTHKRASFIMFKYVFFNNTMPIMGGNENLTFTFNPDKSSGMFSSPENYFDFRLPL